LVSIDINLPGATKGGDIEEISNFQNKLRSRRMKLLVSYVYENIGGWVVNRLYRLNDTSTHQKRKLKTRMKNALRS